MNGSQAQVTHAPLEDTLLKETAGRLIGEAGGSIAVIALAIAGLAGIWVNNLAAIATIVLGAAVLLESGAFSPTTIERGEWASGTFMAGLAGIILGILALLGKAPGTLLSVAVLGFGAGFLFSPLAEWSFGSRALAAVAAVVLGILAVVGLDQIMLVLVALLTLGSVGLITGAMSCARLAIVHRNGLRST